MQTLTNVYVILDRDNYLVQLDSGSVEWRTEEGAKKAIINELVHSKRFSYTRTPEQMAIEGWVGNFRDGRYVMYIDNELIYFAAFKEILPYLLNNKYRIIKVENIQCKS